VKSACESCHEEGYGEFVDEWSEEGKTVLDDGRKLIRDAGDILRNARHEGRSVGEFQTTFQQMVEGINVLERGGAAHNIGFVSDEVDRLGDNLKREMKRLSKGGD
jgi:polyhydroxyalkanoate synthesis regulator phasin